MPLSSAPITSPIVWIEPADGAVLTEPMFLTLSVEVSSNVTDVEFFSTDKSLGRVSTTSYSFLWVRPPVQEHQLTAKATFTDGTTVVSSPVRLTIKSDEQEIVDDRIKEIFVRGRKPVLIEFYKSKEGPIEVLIYNHLGGIIFQNVEWEQLLPGPYAFKWFQDDRNGNPVASGVYLAVFKTPNGEKRFQITLRH